MRASIIGTGRMGKGLAKVLGPVVPDLLWGSRTPEKARQLIAEMGGGNLAIQPADYDQAVEADVIFHTLWFRDLLPWAEKYREALKGKVLVDIVNPFTADFADFTLDWGESAAEKLQGLLPDTSVVGAFKNAFFQVLEQPVHEGLMSDCYVTSDRDEAKRLVMDLLNGIPFRVLDGGRLSNNRTIERLTLFERELAIRYGTYPYVSNRLFGLNG